MKCPHCLIAFHDEWKVNNILDNQDEFGADWKVLTQICPSCKNLMVRVACNRYRNPLPPQYWSRLVYPNRISREPLAKEVPEPYSTDYKEACLVLSDSPKASAALGRRCLQAILKDNGQASGSTLDKQIESVLANRSLPSNLADAIDAVRTLGNFAAHPIKSTSTGEIVDVEPGEADWILDTLEGLFDFYFVQPAKLQAKREALNKKLIDAGKPPLK